MSAPSAESISAARIRVAPVLTGLLLSVFLAMLDAQVVATALPRVVGDLGGLDAFSWITTGYLLTSTVSVPLYGKLGDLFGRKPVFLTAVALFLAGSAACAVAPSMGVLIACRLLQGLGAGGLFVSVLAIIAELFPPRERARYSGYFATCFAVASVAGPLTGGPLTDLLGWRAVFYLNLPIGAVALFLVVRFLRLAPHTRVRARLDVAGLLCLSGAIASLTLLAAWAGSRHSWTSPVILGLGAAAILFAAAFVFAERKAAEPVIPLRLFRDSTFTVSVLVSVVAGFAFLGSVTYLALFVQAASGASASATGLLLAPMMFGVVASSMGSAKIIARTGNYRWYPAAGMALGIVAGILMSTMDESTTRPVVLAYLVLFGLAAGLNLQVPALAAQNTAPREDIGAVSGTVTFLRSLGTALGVSVFGSVFTAGLGTRAPGPADYAHALRGVFFTAPPILLIGLIAALRLKNIPLRQHH
ncbi:MDR family MFS transporter [Amycolatopsis anabasis]|uniref:MDR family MFS transporter n=1 Tax=Amycolatopsis anabasis TaxID=1840409 RepID=UPI00131B6832|nr:MDR family MFS transporter [Amycolatopsis anabasis]